MSIKTRFCASCGKEAELLDNLCADCFFEQKEAKVPRRVSIRYCTKCKSIWFGGTWIKINKPAEDYLIKLVKNKLSLPEGISLDKIEILKAGKEGELLITFKVLNKKVSKKYFTKLLVEKYCCPDCSSQSSRDYKAKIQVREPDLQLDNVIKIIQKGARKAFMRAEEMKNGADFYFSNQSASKDIARKLKKKFNYRMSESVSQYSWDRTKDRPLYRLTILLKKR